MQDHKVIIEPTMKDVKELKDWLFSQGDMRGFEVTENGKEYLILFHSYGHTHSSMVKLLGIGRHFRGYINCIILRTNGEVLSDAFQCGLLDHPVIKAIYHPVEPKWVRE